MMISSTTFAFLLISLCILCFEARVLGLAPHTSKETASTLVLGRRKILAKTFSSAIATAASQSIVLPTFALKSEENPLLSLESAAAQLRDGENDPLSNRLNYPHPGLRRIAAPVTSFGKDLETVVDALVCGMETNASTPVQYGIDARIIILKGVAAPNGSSYYKPDRSNGGEIPITVFCNPNILSRSSEDKMLQWREYCLVLGSNIVWPEGEEPSAKTPSSVLSRGSNQNLLEVDLLRDETVEVAAQDITGKPIRIALQGEASRAFQHELDHLNGILIVDHASLDELPPGIAFLEEPFHAVRQKRAFERPIYQGNGPLYY